jgi:hypothetical protein
MLNQFLPDGRSLMALLAAALAPRLSTQMVLPSMEDKPGKPFSYSSGPTDEIGMMDVPAGTEVTPEDYLCKGHSELMFLAGRSLTSPTCASSLWGGDICPSFTTSTRRIASSTASRMPRSSTQAWFEYSIRS